MLERAVSIPVDGRQSETALMIARGTRRLLRAHGWSTLTELPLATGRRADIVAISSNGDVRIIEIKSSVADFRSDGKWADYRLSCDRLFFAVSSDMPLDIMPEDAGLIIADAFGGSIIRDAPEHRLASATRRALLLRFAQCAADRIHLLTDPSSADFTQS